jgi:hypothetical protein
MPRPASPEARKLCALAIADPDQWEARVRGALVAERGNVAAAAKALGISGRQLWRWIAEKPAILRDTGHKKNPGVAKRHDTLDT